MVDDTRVVESYAEFARTAEPRLRLALCASFGADQGRDSAAEALAFGWQHWEKVKVMRNPVGYLWGVGRNHARRASRRRVVLTDVPLNAMPWIEPGLPDALAALSERQRVAVTLVHGLEWTYGEVADLLGVSKSTVQTQVERGMTKLRRRLGVAGE